MNLRMRFDLNAAALMRAATVGDEAGPVVIVDDILTAPAALVAAAAECDYGRIGPYYPGLRAPLGAVFEESAAAALRPLIAAHFYDADVDIEAYFSVVTTPPAQLAPIQRLPHYDSVDEERLAAVLYLCPPELGGTSFYRHEKTGHELITAARFPEYRAVLEREVAEGGLPPAAYIDDGAPYFKRVARFDAAWNRMLLYRGARLHCSDIRAPEKLSADPRTGRLTITMFMTRR